MQTDTSYRGVVAHQPETEEEKHRLHALKALLTDVGGPHRANWTLDAPTYPDLNPDVDEALVISNTAVDARAGLLDNPDAMFGLGVALGGGTAFALGLGE